VRRVLVLSILIVAIFGHARGSGVRTADAGANLLANGSFETGQSPWFMETPGTFVSVSSPVHAGARAAELSCVDRCRLAQSVAVEGGSDYVLTAWVVKNEPAIRSVTITLEWRDASFQPVGAIRSVSATVNSPDYRALTTGQTAAPAQAAAVIVRLISDGGQAGAASVYFDDASLIRVDVPSPTATSTPSPGATPTPSRTASSTHTPSPTCTIPSTRTPTLTSTPTTTHTLVPTQTSTATATHTLAPTRTATSTQLPAGVLSINEVLYQPAAPVTPVTPEARREWIELYNASSEPVHISNWTLDDGEERELLPDVTAPPGGFVVIAGSASHFLSDYPSFSGVLVEMADGSLGNGLANTGDNLVLRDSSGREIDALSYGNDQTIFDPACPLVKAGHSLEREPPGYDTDRASDFVEQETPSPGRGAFGEATPTATNTVTPTSTPRPSETPTVTAMAGRCRLPILLK
jgi:hypothetical protein